MISHLVSAQFLNDDIQKTILSDCGLYDVPYPLGTTGPYPINESRVVFTCIK